MFLRSSKLFSGLVTSALVVAASTVSAATVNIISPIANQQVEPGETITWSVVADSLLFPISLTVTLEGQGQQTFPISSTASFFSQSGSWTIPLSATNGETFTMSARIDEVAGSPVTATRNVQAIILTPPANDNLVDAIELVGDTGTRTAGDTNAGATSETNENNHDGDSPAASVWYEWTPSVSGDATISTAGSDFDTILAVYTGTTFPLTPVASNDDVVGGAGVTSAVEFATTASQTYFIAVDGFSGDTGTIELSWDAVVISSANDWNLYQ